MPYWEWFKLIVTAFLISCGMTAAAFALGVYHDDGLPRPRPTSLVTAMQNTRGRRSARASALPIPTSVTAP